MMVHREGKYESMVKRHEDRMRRYNICLIIVLKGENRENGKEVIFRGNGWKFSKIDERPQLGSTSSSKG